MSTTTIKTAEIAEPKARPRSFSTALHGPSGEVLRVVAVFRREGARTFVVHSTAKDANGKRVNTRGATQAWPSGEEAVKAVEKVAQAAIAKGWARSQRVAGFAARPDAFDVQHLPVPKTVKKGGK